MGLLFLMKGTTGRQSKLVLSRFPADQGILAEEQAGSLSVEFVEQIFMKSMFAYKSALYSGTNTGSQFWDGMAIDKQANTQHADPISNYWIRDFLLSDFKVTPQQGTRRFAKALKAAVMAAPTAEIQAQLTAAANLAAGLNGQRVTIDSICDHMNLDDEARETIAKYVTNKAGLREEFEFSKEEYQAHIAYRTKRTDRGVLVTADAAQWDEVIEESDVDGTGEVQISTTGKVVDDRFKTKL